MEPKKLCQYCGNIFFKKSNVSRKKWMTMNFCSRECSYHRVISTEGRLAMAENGRRNIAKETKEHALLRGRAAVASRERNGIWKPPMLGVIGELNGKWLGENAGYNAKHRWIQSHWQKAGTCEECGTTPISKGRNRFGTQWSNNDHLYRRIREEWQELCQKCHIKKDKSLAK